MLFAMTSFNGSGYERPSTSTGLPDPTMYGLSKLQAGSAGTWAGPAAQLLSWAGCCPLLLSKLG